MGMNFYKPHVLVLPEDDANRDMFNGFVRHFGVKQRYIQALPPIGGWKKTFDTVHNEHLLDLEKFKNRHLIALIDFDGKFDERIKIFYEPIPENFRNRVYVIGSLDEPEKLRAKAGLSLEQIGNELAQECEAGQQELWAHDLLRHNDHELKRLMQNVRPFLLG